MRADTQVIVVGAGPAGSATAATLAKLGIKVTLLDKAVFPREKTCGDGLTPRAVSGVNEMGFCPVWKLRERMLNLVICKAQRRQILRHLFINTALGLVNPSDGV